MDDLTHLLLAAQAGDHDALERFIATTQHDVASMCRYLGDRDNTDDLIQESYARAIASLHHYRATGPGKNWLLTIVRRTCADATRQRRRRRKLDQRVAVFAHTEPPASGDTERTELDDLLFALHPDRRAAFVATQINGLRYAEAAEVLGVPIGTVRSRVARARQQLIGWIDSPVDTPDQVRGEPDRSPERPHQS